MKPALAGLLLLPLIALTCGHSSEEAAGQDAQAGPEEPRVRLRLSGGLEGRLEPCGCASGQIGGLARRSFRLKQDRGYDVLVEGGHLIVDGSALDELKLYTILNVLDDANSRYDAVGIGPTDLRLEPELLASFLSAFPQLGFVSADLIAADDLGWPAVPFVEREAASGATVRLVGLTMAVPENADEKFDLRAPDEAWKLAMDGVKQETLRVAIGHGDHEAVRALSNLEPRPDLIVMSNAAHAEPLREPEIVNGVPVVHPGIRGRFLLDVTLARVDGEPRVLRYEPIMLQGSRTAEGALEDPATRQLVLDHRFEVAEDGTLEKLAGRHPTPTGADYVGSKACMSCHYSAWQAFQESKHAHAWETLEQAEATGRYAWPVTQYPDCVECHTVAYGERSGFVNPEKTPDLRGVGCEECHGPGSRHVEAPTDHPLGDVDPVSCTTCHDYEQSPDFDYAKRWKAIEHGK